MLHSIHAKSLFGISLLCLILVFSVSPSFALGGLNYSHKSSEDFTLSWTPSGGSIDEVVIFEKRYLTGSSSIDYASLTTLAGSASSWSPTATLTPETTYPEDGIGYEGLGYQVVEYASGTASASAEISSVSTYATPFLRPTGLYSGSWREDDHGEINEFAFNGGTAPDGDTVYCYHKDDGEQVNYDVDNPSTDFPYGTRAYKIQLHYYGWDLNDPDDPLSIEGYSPNVFSASTTTGFNTGSGNGQWYSVTISDASVSRTQMQDAKIRFEAPSDLASGDEYHIDAAYFRVYVEDD